MEDLTHGTKRKRAGDVSHLNVLPAEHDPPLMTLQDYVASKPREGVPQLHREVVTLRVGLQDHLDFTVHKELLCTHSPFFSNALNGRWKEAHDSLIHLRDEDDDRDTIELYINWLYYHDLLLPKFAKPGNVGHGSVSEAVSTASAAFIRELRSRSRFLRRCYVFGNKVQDSDFKDLVIDVWASDFRGTSIPDLAIVSTVWEHSTSDCPARRLVLDMAIEEWADGVFEGLDEHGIVSEYPEFAVELLSGLAKVRNGRKKEVVPYLKSDMCEYHEHQKTNTPCYTTRWHVSVGTAVASPRASIRSRRAQTIRALKPRQSSESIFPSSTSKGPYLIQEVRSNSAAQSSPPVTLSEDLGNRLIVYPRL